MLGSWSKVGTLLSHLGRKVLAMVDFPWAREWPEISDERVRAAFAAVPRAAFVPEHLQTWADIDAPLPIGENQTISQPFVVALMIQAAGLRAGDKVLEIGTGSGYQTALLCELTADEEHVPGETVYSIERYESLSARAAVTLESLGYAPHLNVGDGAAGWPQAAPFDAIVVSAAAAHLPKPLWEQLAENGRLVIPVGGFAHTQILWLLIKQEGKMIRRDMGPVRFVPLVSPLLDDPGMWIGLTEGP